MDQVLNPYAALMYQLLKEQELFHRFPIEMIEIIF
jgi:hypothetical protein